MPEITESSAPPIEGVVAAPDETLQQSIAKMLDDATAKGAARAASQVAPVEDKPVVEPPPPEEKKVVEPPAATPVPAASDDEADFDKEYEKVKTNPAVTKRALKPWERAASLKQEIQKLRTESEERIAIITRERDEAAAQAKKYADYPELETKRAAAQRRADELGAMVDLENNPVFIDKYINKAGELNSAIEGELMSIGVKKDAHKIKTDDGEMDAITVDYINQLGGMVAFARQQPQSYRTLLNEIDKVNPVAADNIRQNVSQLSNLGVAKRRELDGAKTNYAQYQQQYQQQRQLNDQQRAQQIQNAQKGLQIYRDQEFVKHNPLKITPVPDKATAEERTRIEAQNKKAEGLRQKVVEFQEAVFLGKGTPQSLAEGTLRAALYDYERERADQLQKDYEASQAELVKIRQARNPKPDSRVTPPPPARAGDRAPPVQQNGHHNAYNEADDVANAIVADAARRAEDRRLQSAGQLAR